MSVDSSILRKKDSLVKLNTLQSTRYKENKGTSIM